jgi:hypothetical protein
MELLLVVELISTLLMLMEQVLLAVAPTNLMLLVSAVGVTLLVDKKGGYVTQKMDIVLCLVIKEREVFNSAMECQEYCHRV